MSTLLPPSDRIWWRQPIDRVEILWVAIALVWCLVLSFMMPYWHAFGKQNISNTAYHVNPQDYAARAHAVDQKYVCLLVGGMLAIGVALTRWPAVHLLPVDTFYLALTAHGLDMLIFWIIFFEIAVLYFASSSLLRCRLATPRLGWLAFALMVSGGAP